MSENDVVEKYIDSLAEHAGIRRLEDLRNEDSKGKQRTAGDSRGGPLSAFDKEDFRQHVRQTLNDPNTKYIIDTSNDRMVFYNGSEANNARITFTPAQFTEGDGHAGTLMRDRSRKSAGIFADEIKEATKNMGGVTPEIRSVSDGGWIEHLEKYRVQLENMPDRVLGKGDLRTDYARAGDAVKTEPLKPLDYSAPNSPKVDSPLKKAYNVVSEAAGPVVKKTGMLILGAIPIVGMLPNTAEAAELKDKLATAIDNGQISPEAVAEYNIIMAGHIAQGADPTVVLGEAGVQQSFNDWADRYNVQGELRESLQPSSLALMLKDGGTYIAQNIDRLPSATIDVAEYAGQSALAAGEVALNAADDAYDYMSGNTLRTQGIYDALPSVDLQEVTARQLTGDHAALNERGDVLDLLQAKARAEYFEDKMSVEADPDRQAYYGERLQDARNDFETSVEAMDEGQYNDVKDYLATYNQYVQGVAAENIVTIPTQGEAANQEVYGLQANSTQNRIAM
tara:strand:- start:95 stop:1618 length:1524 start_codon:yes stop_codon:yes gene_type:complete